MTVSNKQKKTHFPPLTPPPFEQQQFSSLLTCLNEMLSMLPHWISCTFVQLGDFVKGYQKYCIETCAVDHGQRLWRISRPQTLWGILLSASSSDWNFFILWKKKRKCHHCLPFIYFIASVVIRKSKQWWLHWCIISKWCWFLHTVSAVSAVSSPSVYSLPAVNASKSDRALSTASSS